MDATKLKVPLAIVGLALVFGWGAAWWLDAKFVSRANLEAALHPPMAEFREALKETQADAKQFRRDLQSLAVEFARSLGSRSSGSSPP